MSLSWLLLWWWWRWHMDRRSIWKAVNSPLFGAIVRRSCTIRWPIHSFQFLKQFLHLATASSIAVQGTFRKRCRGWSHGQTRPVFAAWRNMCRGINKPVGSKHWNFYRHPSNCKPIHLLKQWNFGHIRGLTAWHFARLRTLFTDAQEKNFQFLPCSHRKLLAWEGHRIT